MGVKYELHVEMEDGAEWDVTADQRDVAKWELQTFYDDERVFTRMRFMAFAAGTRAGKITQSWPKFDGACVDVSPVKDPEVAADPTQPDPSGDH